MANKTPYSEGYAMTSVPDVSQVPDADKAKILVHCSCDNPQIRSARRHHSHSHNSHMYTDCLGMATCDKCFKRLNRK